MKVKIIELLNKMANGEEVPKKIKHWKTEYQKLDDSTFVQYINKDGYCLDLVQILNDEVEIIEENKPIEEDKPIEELEPVNEFTERYPNNRELTNKINELVKEINKMKEDKK